MTISALAITDEHMDLADAAIGLLKRAKTRASARGGSGYGLSELTIVLEAMGHELCPGPFLPTVTLAALIDASGTEALRAQYLASLATGFTVGVVAVNGSVVVDDNGLASGHFPAVLGSPDADVIAVITADGVLVVDAATDGVAVHPAPDALDATHTIGDISLSGVRVDDKRIIRGGARYLRTLWRVLVAAEAVGLSRVVLRAESAQRLTELAMELAGAAEAIGAVPEVTRDYLFARCLTIAGGTSEIMRNTIAERLLGLARDPLLR